MTPICIGCGKPPAEIPEYVDGALLLPLIRDQGRWRYVREHRHYALLCGREGFGYSFSQVEHWSNEQNVALLDKEVDKARGET